MSKVFSLRAFIISTLRRASYRWKPREEARRNARVDRNKYTCAQCKGIFGRAQTKLDHIDPVIPLETGFTTFDSYIERLFCDVSNFQCICVGCHRSKTQQENIIRKAARAKKLLDQK